MAKHLGSVEVVLSDPHGNAGTFSDRYRRLMGLPRDGEDDPRTTYIEAIKVLEDVGIAYLSIADGGLG